MRQRAEQVDRTRQRITEAAVQLHTTVGPARTSISALAEAAGVTRLTVYRHFANEEQLFVACQQHWAQQHPAPDPGSWLAVPPVEPRAGLALGEWYAWYRENADDLYPIQRDFTAMPAGLQQAVREQEAALAEILLVGCGFRGRRRRRMRAAAGHALDYWTWRSLEVEQGLPPDETVDLAVRIVVAAAQ